jgi:ribosomal protein L15
LNVKVLNLLPTGTEVTIDSLIKHKIIDSSDAKTYGVKILGDGDLTVSLNVMVPVSKGAAKKIEKAGGSILKSV